MTIKEIVERYWRDFEIVAFHAVKNALPQGTIIHETLTQALKDGGYDGEFILISQEDPLLKIVFEAKLRSNAKADLPLKDFAKALVVAVVRQADMIYIVTNLHFSKETISVLERYADSTLLNIQLLNGYSVKEFVKMHGNELNDIHVELKDFLLAENGAQHAQTMNSNVVHDNNFIVPEEIARDCFQCADFFNIEKGTLLVTGSVGSGKSYFIEWVYRTLKYRKKRVCLIDLSACLTYKDLFLEITSKTLGLSLELVNLMDEDAFVVAFSQIGLSNANEDDIRMLRFLFARETEYPYDYSILFSQIVDFYYRVLGASPEKNSIIVSFLNLSYAQKEVLQLLLYFLKRENAFSSILEVTSDDYCGNNTDNWLPFKEQLMCLCKFQPYVVEDWTVEKAHCFLLKNTVGISEEQVSTLVQKFGHSPAELSNLIEIINYTKLYDHVPKELVYREILAIKVTKFNHLYFKCLEYMQYANSDVLYLYAFVFFLSGEVSLSLLLQYFLDETRLRKCLSIIGKSNLFSIVHHKLTIKNARIAVFFEQYFEKNIFSFSTQPVANFLKKYCNFLHLSLEKQLELNCRLTFYETPECHIHSLISLGNQYQKMGQTALAEEKYRRAHRTEQETKSSYLSDLTKMQIRLGLAETLIWKIGSFHSELKKHLSDISQLAIVAKCDSYQYKHLMLRYYLVAYQFFHAQNLREIALEYASTGVKWIEKHDLYTSDIELCGQMWRYYAIAVKETSQNIETCLAVFEDGFAKCNCSAKFLFGYTIHLNMVVCETTSLKQLRKKLANYAILEEHEKKLSIDEYLHYRTNVAALHFLLKEYETAWREYEELLDISSIFGIMREEIRILNDMANICWIREDLKEARKKYYTAKKLGEIGGHMGNYWPILINIVSFETFSKHYSAAWETHILLRPHLQQICLDVTDTGLSFERKEYLDAALKIHLTNLWNMFQNTKRKDIIEEIEYLWSKSPFSCTKTSQQDAFEKWICDVELRGTIFNHGDLFLLKN